MSETIIFEEYNATIDGIMREIDSYEDGLEAVTERLKDMCKKIRESK